MLYLFTVHSEFRKYFPKYKVLRSNAPIPAARDWVIAPRSTQPLKVRRNPPPHLSQNKNQNRYPFG